MDYAKFSKPVEYEFDIGLSDVTITHSIGTTAYSGGSRSAPDFQGGVNVSAEGKIQGVSVGQPTFTFALKKYWGISEVTQTYQLMLRDLCGRFNNATFYGLAAGSCRFIGAKGRPERPSYWPIEYRFE